MHRIFLICSLVITFSLSAKPTICLNMIVKDESAVITRCLDSIKPIIDYWVIVDTGSSDDTIEVIKSHMKDIPGEIYERPWKNFGHNRKEALTLAQGKGDYFLFIDADDWFEYDDDFQMPELTHDLYMINLSTNGFSYLVPKLIRASIPWRWEGVLHEYLVTDVEYSSSMLTSIRYIIGGNGGSSQDPQKYVKYAQILEEVLKEEPDNTRYAFYLAESYRDAGELIKAFEWYQRRVDMGGWDQEIYWSLLHTGHIVRKLKMPIYEVIDRFHRAYCFRPHRPEAAYFLIELYNQEERYELAYATLKAWDFIPQPLTKDILFNLDWIEEYGFLFQMTICAYYLGHYQEAVDACDQVLAMPNLPDNLRDQTKINRAFSAEKILARGHCP